MAYHLSYLPIVVTAMSYLLFWSYFAI